MDYYIKHQNATILYQFGIEVELVAGGDTHLIELSHTQTLVGFDQHLGIYLGRAELGTGNIVIAFLPVDDDLHLLSYLLSLDLSTNVLLESHGLVEPFLLHLLRHIVLIMIGAVGSLFLRIGEGTHTLEARPTYKLHQ